MQTIARVNRVFKDKTVKISQLTKIFFAKSIILEKPKSVFKVQFYKETGKFVIWIDFECASTFN